jgi:hypothetical protein
MALGPISFSQIVVGWEWLLVICWVRHQVCKALPDWLAGIVL